MNAITSAVRVEQIGNATLYLGDYREVLPGLVPVDAVVTSPPYAQQRDYEQKITDWTALMVPLCGIQTTPDAQILINLGLVHKEGEIYEYWDDFKREMRAAGWRYFGQYVWDKGYGRPGDCRGRLAPSHELVFHFNRLPRQPVKWIPTQERPASFGSRDLRAPNGALRGLSSPDKCGQPFKIPDSVIRISPQMSRGGLEDAHPAVYPIEFADHLCRTFSTAAGPVLDPFLGSGTTGVACAKLGRTFIGCEIEPRYFDIACRRIEHAQRQADLFVAPVREDPSFMRTADLFTPKD